MLLRDISNCGVESVLARLVHSYEKTDRSREVEVKPRYYGGTVKRARVYDGIPLQLENVQSPCFRRADLIFVFKTNG